MMAWFQNKLDKEENRAQEAYAKLLEEIRSTKAQRKANLDEEIVNGSPNRGEYTTGISIVW